MADGPQQVRLRQSTGLVSSGRQHDQLQLCRVVRDAGGRERAAEPGEDQFQVGGVFSVGQWSVANFTLQLPSPCDYMPRAARHRSHAFRNCYKLHRFQIN